ncbi:hypothetical protein [Arcticibacter eurypsychrophilus]|uniref:hypothetical protein n=1 Tax=Arcticibacter eurypsychrophilus TaxID=1434752 RepID=UPI00084D9690|nr:hypothetical protein [Arcticibacter eurypsychrophilus]
MQEERTIAGETEDQIWNQVNADFSPSNDLLDYHVVLDQAGRRILLDMGIDLGGGFESGSAYTTFSAYLYGRSPFRFSIHKQGFIDEIGKFFGMQDVVLGYLEFDEKFIVKTNSEVKAVEVFADEKVRKVLLSYQDLDFGIVEYAMENSTEKAPFLELKIKAGITDPILLREIYSAFYLVIQTID